MVSYAGRSTNECFAWALVMIFTDLSPAGLSVLLATLIIALLLDSLLGEPRKFHPLVGFGHLLKFVEDKLGVKSKEPDSFITDISTASNWLKLRGAVAWLLLCVSAFFIVLTGLGALAAISLWTVAAANVFLLYLTLGMRSLGEHANWVEQPLLVEDVQEARSKVGWLVSRETTHMQTEDVTKACIESVLENGNDAVFGALFWYLIAGAPGAVLYRLANTLDASWGYRNDRYREFGWWAARADDWLNYIPARICAAFYSVCGNWRLALKDWQVANHWRLTEGRGFASPNAGIVMATGAGALGISLGGEAIYDGEKVYKPQLGSGRQPVPNDISRAMLLLSRAVWSFIALLSAIVLLSFLIIGS